MGGCSLNTTSEQPGESPAQKTNKTKRKGKNENKENSKNPCKRADDRIWTGMVRNRKDGNL